MLQQTIKLRNYVNSAGSWTVCVYIHVIMLTNIPCEFKERNKERAKNKEEGKDSSETHQSLKRLVRKHVQRTILCLEKTTTPLYRNLWESKSWHAFTYIQLMKGNLVT